MGSATLTDARPVAMAENEKNTFKNLLKKPLQVIFRKKNKKKELEVEKTNVEANKVPRNDVPDVDTLKENLEKLCLGKKKTKAIVDEEEDEFKNFTIKRVDNDEDRDRHNSDCSGDSGFSDNHQESDKNSDADDASDELTDNIDANDEVTGDEKIEVKDELIDGVDALKIDVKDDKKAKKLQTVYVSRGPIRQGVCDKNYAAFPYQQIRQINQQTLTGSQVFVNNTTLTETINAQNGELEMNIALTEIQRKVDNFPLSPQEDQIYWQSAQDFLRESLQNTDQDILSDFIEIEPSVYPVLTEYPVTENTVNPIEEFASAETYYNDKVDFTIDELQDIDIMLTPPRSNQNQLSPSSFSSPSPSNFYSTQASNSVVSSDYLLSPALSSPNFSNDYENYQDLTQYDDASLPVFDVVENADDANDGKTGKAKTMKQFKDLQNDLASSFAKKDCCKRAKVSCKDVFRECFDKLSSDERNNLCLKVAKLDLKMAYGVLHHIMIDLSTSDDEKPLQYALFGMLCERILAQKSALFFEEFGLNLLKAASLRCHKRPILTKYIVQCISIALNTDEGRKAVPTGPVFSEVDKNGDTLISALARRGDECSSALAEIALASDGELPLFDVHHHNTDGHTALHIACMQHGDSVRCLDTVHVLITHANADLWKGDMKGGDTALHHAVRSVTCDLQLVMVIFKHVDRKMWKQLAHVHNRSTATPLDLARVATKSPSRRDYPREVLDFLKKCR